VRRAGNVLTVVSVQASAGWTYEVEEDSGSEVHVVFRKGELETSLTVKLENGVIVTELETGS
jgi:hypothetical protein